MISVLALNSLWATSSSEGAVEVVLRADEDDRETVGYLLGIAKPNFRLLVGPRKDGYKSLASFFNQMAKTAAGNLLMTCNDDVIFKTANWNRFVEEAATGYPDGIFDIGVNAILNPQYFVFPIVSRRWVEILGYIHDERLLFQGKFVRDVADALDRAIFLPSVIVHHDWGGFANDETSIEAQRWMKKIVLDNAGRWRKEYQEHHDRVVAEVVERLRPYKDG